VHGMLYGFLWKIISFASYGDSSLTRPKVSLSEWISWTTLEVSFECFGLQNIIECYYSLYSPRYMWSSGFGQSKIVLIHSIADIFCSESNICHAWMLNAPQKVDVIHKRITISYSVEFSKQPFCEAREAEWRVAWVLVKNNLLRKLRRFKSHKTKSVA
jgi:hypothetical protein